MHDLMNTYTSSSILSNIDPAGVFLVTSVKGFNLFSLSALFLSQNASLVYSQRSIYVVLFSLVLKWYLSASN